MLAPINETHPWLTSVTLKNEYEFHFPEIKCKRLLKKELVHFIASDAHDTNKRAPKLMDCVNYIGKKYGDVYMEKIFYDNPQKLLKDEYI